MYNSDFKNKNGNTKENFRNRSENVRIKTHGFNLEIKDKISPTKYSINKNINSIKYKDNIEINNLKNEKIEESMYRSQNKNIPKRNISKFPNIQQYNKSIHMKLDLDKNNNISYRPYQQLNITTIEDESKNKVNTPIRNSISKNKLYKSIDFEEYLDIKPKGLIGLANIGAYCFMNATIQCFSNIPRFRNGLLSNSFYKDLYNNRNHTKKLSFALAEVFKNLWLNNSIKYYSPNYFKEIISEMNPLFKEISANVSKYLTFLF